MDHFGRMLGQLLEGAMVLLVINMIMAGAAIISLICLFIWYMIG